MSAARTRSSATDTFRRLEQFVREYAGGFSAADLRRTLDRDATRAWGVLAADRGGEPEPGPGFKRWLHRAKILFLGVSYRLSPPRRLVFLLAVVAGLAALGDSTIRFRSGEAVQLSIDLSGFWFLISFSALLYLLVVELVERALVRDELEIARGVQRDLMPAAAPEIEGWSFAHSYRTANEVGGDAYDFLPLEDGRLALVIADASGHGMAAGLVMAVASATWRSAVEVDPSPARVAGAVHRALRRAPGRRSFLSLFFALLDPRTGALEGCIAGHPFPLVLRTSGLVEELGSGALPLGLRHAAEPAPLAGELGPGDLLVLYTDGLVETLGRDGSAFGHERLRGALEPGGSAAAVHDRILAAFTVHLGDEPLTDDLSLIVLARG